jgi:hypothetical protein
VCPASVSNADDITVTSLSQNKELYVDYSTYTSKYPPPEGNTTAVIDVMRGKPKDDYNYHCSNKHCKQTLVHVLLDSGSEGDLVLIRKDEPMLLPYSKRLVPQWWNTLNGTFKNNHKARVELNFFDLSDSKRYYSEPNVIKYENIVSCSMTSFLVWKP